MANEENHEEKKKVLETINNFIPQLKDFVQSESVFGKPYELNGVTIIPINSIKIGFGFGSRDMIKKPSSGGGGAISMTPTGFIVIKGDSVTLHNLNGGQLENVLEKVPDFLDKMVGVFEKTVVARAEKKKKKAQEEQEGENEE